MVISTDINYDVYVGNVTFASPRRCKGRGSFPEGSIESANSFAERGNDRSVPQRFPGVFAVTALAGTHWPHAGARDHYALCVGPYGNFSAHPVLTRTNRIDLKHAAQLLYFAVDNVHTDTSSGHLGYLVSRGKAGMQNQLECVTI